MKSTVLTVNIILLIILIPSIFGALMSPMMFDAPGSEKSKKTWTLVCCLAALPILIIISQIVSWIAYSNQNYNLALKFNALPAFDILIIIFMFFVIDQFAN
jgi:O-antigen/teichoic acid export membrane protein